MTIRWPSDMLNRFIAPDIDKFDRADIPDLRNRHPESSHWLGNHFLNNVLRGSFGAGAPRQFAANLIFRADTAFQRYHQARDATNEFVAASSAGSPAARKYF